MDKGERKKISLERRLGEAYQEYDQASKYVHKAFDYGKKEWSKAIVDTEVKRIRVERIMEKL